MWCRVITRTTPVHDGAKADDEGADEAQPPRREEAVREVEREHKALERNQKKLVTDIKKLAKQGQMNAVKIMAKDSEQVLHKDAGDEVAAVGRAAAHGRDEEHAGDDECDAERSAGHDSDEQADEPPRNAADNEAVCYGEREDGDDAGDDGRRDGRRDG